MLVFAIGAVKVERQIQDGVCERHSSELWYESVGVSLVLYEPDQEDYEDLRLGFRDFRDLRDQS